MVVSVICLNALMCSGVFGPLLSAATYVMAEDLNVSIGQIAQLSGYLLLAGAAALPFVSGFARKYGKRPQFVFATILAVVGSGICSFSTSIHALLGGRMLQGLSGAAYESLTISVVGDLFFVHERGTLMSLIAAIFTSIVSLGGIIPGPITLNLGWPWTFRICLIFMVVFLFLVFFLVWETCYVRNSLLELTTTDLADLNEAIRLEKEDKPYVALVEGEVSNESRAQATTVNHAIPLRRRSYWSRISLWNGTFTDENIIKLILRTFAVGLNPVTLWGIVTTGLASAWVLCLSFTIAQLYGGPPWNYDSVQIGAMYTGPLVLSFIACIVLSLCNDPLAIWMARRNGGVYEPEFRIPLLAFALVTGCISLFPIGYAYDAGKGAVVTAVFFGFISVTQAICLTSVTSYLVDAYRKDNVEMFMLTVIARNCISYGFSLFVNNWVFHSLTASG